jgi:hypothetical protein
METCSRCRGIRVHDPVETLFTIAWNTHDGVPEFWTSANSALFRTARSSESDLSKFQSGYFRFDDQSGVFATTVGFFVATVI